MVKIICHNHEGKIFEVDSSDLIFRPSMYGVLIEGDKILLSKQFDGYDFPGGGVNINETLDEALKREFFEETGFKVNVLMPFYCKTSFFHPTHSLKHKNEYWSCILIYCLVERLSGSISKENFDEEEKKYVDLPEWININEVSKLKFYNSVDSPAVIAKAVELIKK